jgi:flagellar hook-associated protein FlgK
MGDLILYQQAYAAAARVISVIQDMFDALERAV